MFKNDHYEYEPFGYGQPFLLIAVHSMLSFHCQRLFNIYTAGTLGNVKIITRFKEHKQKNVKSFKGAILTKKNGFNLYKPQSARVSYTGPSL